MITKKEVFLFFFIFYTVNQSKMTPPLIHFFSSVDYLPRARDEMLHLAGLFAWDVPQDWRKVNVLMRVSSNCHVFWLFRELGCSLARLVLVLFPEMNWEVGRFGLEGGRIQKRAFFFSCIFSHLRISIPYLWYHVGRDRLEEARRANSELVFAYSCIKSMKGCELYELLVEFFPELEWQLWRFKSLSPDFWTRFSLRNDFLNYLGEKLGLRDRNDWYSLTPSQIRYFGGEGLLRHYEYSVSYLLLSHFSSINWEWWKFNPTPGFLWNDVKNQREYLDWLGVEMAFDSPSQMSNLTVGDLEGKYGKGILFYHNNSIPVIIDFLYPEVAWKMSVKGEESVNGVEYAKFLYLSHAVKIKELRDWYRVSVSQIERWVGKSFVQSTKRLGEFLARLYPSHPWDESKFVDFTKKSQQYELLSKLKSYFSTKSEDDIVENYKTSWLSTSKIELDIFIPSLAVAYEYQGEQHFGENAALLNLSLYRRCDLVKERFCSHLGISLLDVSFWDVGEKVEEKFGITRPDLLV